MPEAEIVRLTTKRELQSMDLLQETTQPDGAQVRLFRLTPPEEDAAVIRRLGDYLFHSLGSDNYRQTAMDINAWRLYYLDSLAGRYAAEIVDHIYIAEVNGTPAARLWFGYSRKSGHGNFGNVLTEPEWRQRGLLNLLLDRFSCDFAAEPVNYLCCGSDTPHAIRCYRRHGFRMLYGGESGLMCLGKGDFFEEAARCYPGPGAVTIRPGTIADQLECDRFLACIPVMQSLREPGADSGICNYRTAFQESLSGRACVMAVENETGADAGFAFAAVTPAGDRLDFVLHPDYLSAGPELLRRTAAEFRRRFGRTPLLAAAPEDAMRQQLAREAGFVPAEDSRRLFRPPME